jgi:hypothetical protein
MSVDGIFGVASLFGLEQEIQRVMHERSPKMKRQIRTDLQGKTTKREADPAKLAPDKTQGLVNNERTVESELPQGRGESLVSQPDSAVNQAEQLRDQQIQQQYSDKLGVYVQEKAQQIDRLQSSLTAVLTSEQVRSSGIEGARRLRLDADDVAVSESGGFRNWIHRNSRRVGWGREDAMVLSGCRIRSNLTDENERHQGGIRRQCHSTKKRKVGESKANPHRN